MGFRLKITLKTERKFIVLTTRPVAGWCSACGSESSFVDEEREAAAMSLLPGGADTAHTTILNGRRHVCLRSITREP